MFFGFYPLHCRRVIAARATVDRLWPTSPPPQSQLEPSSVSDDPRVL